VLDGEYRTNAKGEPEFIETTPASDEQVWEVLQRIIKRIMKQLVRRGILVEVQGETYLADDGDDSKESRTLAPLHRGSCVYRITFSPRAGQEDGCASVRQRPKSDEQSAHSWPNRTSYEVLRRACEGRNHGNMLPEACFEAHNRLRTHNKSF
jgi:hypothetical protein